MADGADTLIRRDYTEFELARMSKTQLVALICQIQQEYRHERKALLFVVEHNLLELCRMGDDLEQANIELARLRARLAEQ